MVTATTSRAATKLKVKLDASVRIGRSELYPLPPELIALLRSIRQHGSLVRATREVGVSYRHAWGLIGRWEAIIGQKLAILTRGQGTGLTAFGTRLAGIEEWLEARIDNRLEAIGDELAAHLAIPSAPGRQEVRVHASHDIALLKLKERLGPHLALNLQFEGSLNSLDSLARGACDIAGFHLPQPPALLGPLLAEFRARLDAREHYVALLLSRHQGLMFAKVPKRRIRSFRDVAKLGLRFVNRERGSGTRLLFDALLAREGLEPAQIAGYDHEEFTHMATAATVRARMADVTFGIEAAARAHGLGFARVVSENYFVACKRNSPTRIALDTLVAAARTTAFLRTIAALGGYDTKVTRGTVALGELLGRQSPG